VSLALRTQQIIAEEMGWPNTITARRGYFVESPRTSWRSAYEYSARSTSWAGGGGGQSAALPQRERSPTPAFRAAERDRRRPGIRGGCSTPTSEGDRKGQEILRIDPALERKQIDRGTAVRAQRRTRGGPPGARPSRPPWTPQASAGDPTKLMTRWSTARAPTFSGGRAFVQKLQQVWGDLPRAAGLQSGRRGRGGSVSE